MPVGTTLRRGASRVVSTVARKAREALRRRRGSPDLGDAAKKGVTAAIGGGGLGIAAGGVERGRRQRRAARDAADTKARAALERRRHAAEQRIRLAKERAKQREEGK